MKSFNRYLNIVLILFAMFVIGQRVPVLIEMFKREGSQFEPETIQTLDGKSVTIPSTQNQVLIFWATWCTPCRIELARINNLVANGTIKPESVIALSMGEDHELVRSHIIKQNYKFLIGIDENNKLAEKYKVAATPTILFIDKTGVIQWMTMGISPSLELRLKHFLN